MCNTRAGSSAKRSSRMSIWVIFVVAWTRARLNSRLLFKDINRVKYIIYLCPLAYEGSNRMLIATRFYPHLFLPPQLTDCDGTAVRL